MPKYIGLSLSNCVKDILDGKIEIDNVAFIISGTHIIDRESMLAVVDIYHESYWKYHRLPEIINVIETLFFSGRFIQPRIVSAPTCFIGTGHWTKFNPERFDEYINYINEQMRVTL